jgi:transposase
MKDVGQELARARRRCQRLEAEHDTLCRAHAALRSERRRLRAENRRLQSENDKLRTGIDKLRTEKAELLQRLAKAERAGKRQAAPFSDNNPKTTPRKNGRKAGAQHGKHAHRPPPNQADIDECYEAPLPHACPHCGGRDFTDVETAEQFQEELPRQPLRRKFTIHRGTCRACGRRVQGRHPLQTSDATGACAAQLGADAQAGVVYLNKHAGLSYKKISATYTNLLGIPLSRGAAAQIVLRAAKKLQPALQEIHQRLADSQHLTPDETGWRLGGHPVWLHAWVGDGGATAYAIDPQRSADALERIIGIDWSGDMTHDGCSSYDRFREANHQQCVDHALRRAESLTEKYPDNKSFPTRIIDIFTNALELRDHHLAGDLDEATLYHWHEELVDELLHVSAKRYRTEAYRTFAKHLYQHGEQWFLFMIDPSIPATNHRAEQALRTPIVNRKVFGGNQEPAGARAQEVTCSVLQTCKNRARDFIRYVSDALRGHLTSLFR